ncbi:MAG: DUF1508 domain-containing protein [Treponema sp.]|jgi:uncharacterized protein YegP (UPF0339 family)|nr:DUF1508 domain-containing protein [Treponema sp.]
MAAKFTVYLDRAKHYRFNLKASNGEIIAASESYPDKKSALKGIASIQKNAAAAKIVDDTGESEAPRKPGRKPTTAKAKAVPKSKTISKKRFFNE